MYKKILVPLDGSDLAGQVLPHVCALAECTGAEIVLLEITPSPVYHFTVVDKQADVTQGHVGDGATVYLNEVAADLRAAGFSVTCEVVTAETGEIAESILEYADEIHADMIAMSTHGRSGLRRLVLGSIAEHVVRSSKAPVLLVRPVSPSSDESAQ